MFRPCGARQTAPRLWQAHAAPNAAEAMAGDWTLRERTRIVSSCKLGRCEIPGGRCVGQVTVCIREGAKHGLAKTSAATGRVQFVRCAGLRIGRPVWPTTAIAAGSSSCSLARGRLRLPGGFAADPGPDGQSSCCGAATRASIQNIEISKIMLPASRAMLRCSKTTGRCRNRHVPVARPDRRGPPRSGSKAAAGGRRNLRPGGVDRSRRADLQEIGPMNLFKRFQLALIRRRERPRVPEGSGGHPEREFAAAAVERRVAAYGLLRSRWHGPRPL